MVSSLERNRVRASLPVVTVVVVALVVAAVVSPAPAVGEDPGPERYLDTVFDDVTVTTDILYRTTVDGDGNPVDLHLDLYEPTGDLMERRPLLLWLHGGGFTGGNRAGGRAVRMSTEFAKRGFVVASLDYRTGDTAGGIEDIGDPDFLDAILTAYQDIREGVRWLRLEADRFGVDEDAISAAGYSAGGVLALLQAYLPLTPPEPGNSNWPTRVAASVSIAGTAIAGLVQPGEPPSFFAHGDHDPRVPYSSAVNTCQAVMDAGSTCEFFTLVGGQHDPSAFEPEIRERAAAFLFAEVLAPRGYTTAVAPATTPTIAPTSTVGADTSGEGSGNGPGDTAGEPSTTAPAALLAGRGAPVGVAPPSDAAVAVVTRPRLTG